MTVRFTNVKAFRRELKEFQEKTKIAPDTIARRLTLSIFRGVIQRTPVDTGWARANWQMAAGMRPVGNPVPEPAENNVLPEPRTFTVPKSLGDFTTYWVVNNVPYIVTLEEGRSQQMGKGFMVQRTLVAAREEIKRALRDIRR